MLGKFGQHLQRRLEQQRIMSVLGQHANKNFVQRILYPENNPILPLDRGQFATHKMSWTTVDGRPIVYPKVIQDQRTGKLRELSHPDAIAYALHNNEFIPMDNVGDADWLSSNYKKVWDMNGKNISLASNLRRGY